MKTRRFLISILTGLCVCLMGAGMFTACEMIPQSHTHSYTQEITKDPTCAEEGLITYSCSCNHTYTVKIPVTSEHVWNEGEFTTQPTCMDKGVKTFTCINCQTATYTEEAPALGHLLKTHEVQAPTCSEIGLKEYITCEREGCLYSVREELPPTGEHTWDEGIITTEPTCTKKGVKTFTCTTCQKATYTEDVATLEHDEKTHEGKAPTCAEIGWKEYVTCQREG